MCTKKDYELLCHLLVTGIIFLGKCMTMNKINQKLVQTLVRVHTNLLLMESLDDT
jgi:hypothetical protein